MTGSTDNLILDFSDMQAAGSWQAVDDRIMGGCSQSHPKFHAGTGLRFTGTVSLENNGGFASIRSASSHWDLGRYQGLKLRLQGDGKDYKLSLRTDLYYDGVSYQAAFGTREGGWQEITLPFADFTPTHHGIRLTTVPPLDPSSIRSFGLFIAGRQAGPFCLDLAWIAGVTA